MMGGRQRPIYDRLVRKLTDAFRPQLLRIRDETHLHASHAQSPGLPETHFRVHVVSEEFTNMALLQRHRRVYDVLAAELSERVHALSIIARTPQEQQDKTKDSDEGIDQTRL